MKQAFAILGAALLVALGLFLPRLTAAYQDQNLAGDVRRMKNAAVSLTLAEEVMELTELDLFQSLALFSNYVTRVELTEGRYTSAKDALQIAGELTECVNATAYWVGDETEAVPFLLTDEDGNSGIFWRCGWEDRPDESVWIDDQNSNLAGFCLDISTQPLEGLCQVICGRFFPPYLNIAVLTDNAEARVVLSRGEESVVLPAYYTMKDQFYYYPYFNFNMPIRSNMSTSGDMGANVDIPAISE